MDLLFRQRRRCSQQTLRSEDVMRKTCFLVLTAVCAFYFQNVCARDVKSFQKGEQLFAIHIKPLLTAKCLACHGQNPNEIEGGLDMRSREGLLKGGDTFEKDVLIPGDSQHSLLYITTTRTEEGFEMPPKEADRLSKEQQQWIRDWIDTGAPWPNDERVHDIQAALADGEQVVVSKALSAEWQNRRYDSEKLWAYRPIRKHSIPPKVHPIDWFINKKIEQSGLSAAPPADAHVFLRRIRFGLTGLPPSPHEVKTFADAFCQDPERAVINVVDRLLASPHYGEHFGSHWLDVARYADTAGFANDYHRPNAWRYRDYVVRSFNRDTPYNDFVRQQLAGDEIDEKKSENLIATGFLRMGPWEQTGMSVFKETRGQWLDDVTDSVGQTFLAHSMSCCKCHDHKFDPVPTRDYYRMMAVFSTTQFAERTAPFLTEENQNGFAASNAWVEDKISLYQIQKKQLQKKIERDKKQEVGDAKTGKNGLDPGDEASLSRLTKNITRHSIEKDRTKPFALATYTGATIHRKNVSGRLIIPDDRWAEGEIEKDAIHSGGDVYSLADPVTPGALSAAESLGSMRQHVFVGGKQSRRLALANWIVDPSNPLTARVIVNRVWSWHFGKGIAANPNNFGGTGGQPTHPELLDFLARWFMDNDWSIKKLNRLIVTSKAYRRSSNHPNPDNLENLHTASKLYAIFLPRRLTAEELRDAMLVVSGEINLAVGGIPCRPDIDTEIAFQPRQIMGGTASVYEPDSSPSQRNRRTLYAERIRGLRDPFLETFNQPGPDKSCEIRETSTIAPQALTLINSKEVFERSIAFAIRLKKEHLPDRRAILVRAFALALSRQPTDQEMNTCLTHWKNALQEERVKQYPPDDFPNQITRTVMAEKTGQPYTFIEHMPAYSHYEPDIQPGAIDANTRSLAHICRVLLNTNEFVYVD